MKRNKFVSANGVEIKKDTDISSDIRALLNHLVNKEQIIKSNEDKGDIKGMIRADCKTIVEIVNDEKCNNEKGINVDGKDTVKDCHKGHPQLSPTNLGLLKLCDDPKPRFVRKGPEILILGSAWIGEEPHWFKEKLKKHLNLLS